MSLAQRVREFRYSKGWGPDELASRAEISRTALYQIESGKTELPRAGTLRRIAVALDVPMEDLLGGASEESGGVPGGRPQASRPQRGRLEWTPSDPSPVRPKMATAYHGVAPAMGDDGSSAEAFVKPRSSAVEAPYIREGELMAKLHDLIHSPFGECITGVVDDLHRILAQIRAAG